MPWHEHCIHCISYLHPLAQYFRYYRSACLASCTIGCHANLSSITLEQAASSCRLSKVRRFHSHSGRHPRPASTNSDKSILGATAFVSEQSSLLRLGSVRAKPCTCTSAHLNIDFEDCGLTFYSRQCTCIGSKGRTLPRAEGRTLTCS